MAKIKTLLAALIAIACIGPAARAQDIGVMVHPIALLSQRYSLSINIPVDSNFAIYGRGYYSVYGDGFIRFQGIMAEGMVKWFPAGDAAQSGPFLAGGVYALFVTAANQYVEPIFALPFRGGYQYTFGGAGLLDAQAGLTLYYDAERSLLNTPIIPLPTVVLGIGLWLGRL